ncbi:UNVERIFIED_CONTAM: hypothetical protein RMT77_018994 [Armadillidium vulgare]
MEVFKNIIYIIIIINCEYLEVHSKFSSWLYVKVNVNETCLRELNVEFLNATSPSALTCGHKTGEMNSDSFLYDENVCSMFNFYDPCQLSRCLNSDDDKDEASNYYSIFHVKAFNKIPKEVKYYNFAECVWQIKTTANYSTNFKECEKDGGNLITYENFPTESDFSDFVTASGFTEILYVGALQENGAVDDFVWISGAKLEKESFLWGSGEPNEGPEEECVVMYLRKLADARCTIKYMGICQARVLLW